MLSKGNYGWKRTAGAARPDEISLQDMLWRIKNQINFSSSIASSAMLDCSSALECVVYKKTLKRSYHDIL